MYISKQKMTETSDYCIKQFKTKQNHNEKVNINDRILTIVFRKRTTITGATNSIRTTPKGKEDLKKMRNLRAIIKTRQTTQIN